MTTIDHVLAGIARKHLGISTLATRRSDSLDFHNVAVWTVANALKAAFDAGADAGRLTCTPPSLTGTSQPTRFDDYEIHGMKRLPVIHGLEQEPAGWVTDNSEPVPDDEAEFWSLFGHIPGQGLDCIGDFTTREHAEEIYARITGRRYGHDAECP